MACDREGSGMVPKVCGKLLWKRVLALLGSLGQCAVADSLHALECPKEVWTAR